MKKPNFLIYLAITMIILTVVALCANEAKAFVDYDSKITNPYSQFTLDNADHFSYIPMYDEKIIGLEGLTVFPLRSLRYLMENGTTSLRWFDDRFKLPFNVTLNYDSNDYGMENLPGNVGWSDYYNILRVEGETRQAEINIYTVQNDISSSVKLQLIDKAIIHGLQHILTAHKSGKLLTTDFKNHDSDPNEQIAMTNDILRLLELKSKRGVTWERLENYGKLMIANYERQKLPERVFQWNMALALFSSYLSSK
jgi:hypothetical protein